jgi:hypothetical protein
VLLDPPPRQLTRARIQQPRTYDQARFRDRMTELKVPAPLRDAILGELSDPFELPALHAVITRLKQTAVSGNGHARLLDAVERIASTNYKSSARCP